MSISSKLRPICVNPALTHTATVIFLHGSGDTGQGIREWLNMVLGKEFEIDNTKIVYPTAPPRPYTPMEGNMSTVWFDRKKISPFEAEDLTTVDPMCANIQMLVENEEKQGISRNRIILGGFSMGGSLAFQVAYRFCTNLGATFALSSFLNDDSAVYEAIKKNPNCETLPSLFQCHGMSDPLVDFKWGKKTSENLQKLGIDVTFHPYKNMYHELKKDEILKLKEWIVEKMNNSKL